MMIFLPLISSPDKVDEARSALLENVTSSISQLKISMDDVDARIADVNRQLGRLPGTERQLIRIQRDFDLNSTVYNFLLEKRAEAGIAMASKVSDNKIIDEAVPYNAARIKPKTQAELHDGADPRAAAAGAGDNPD